MSRKLIILPYNLYKSLLSAPAKPDEDLQGKAPLEEAKVALWRSKRVRRGEDLSARNMIHQQMLRSYVKARKEFAEKPLKLQMGELRALLKERDDALKAILEGEEEETGGISLQEPTPGIPLPESAKMRKKTLKLKRKMRKILAAKGLIPKRRRIKAEEEYEEEGEVEEGDVFGTPKASPSARIFATSGPSFTSPYCTRRNVSASGLTKHQIDEQKARAKVQELFNYVKLDPTRFEIQGNNIMLNGKPIQGSDVAASISRILVPLWHAADPPGTSQLRTKLAKDDFFKMVDKEIKALDFRPHSMQFGEGKMMFAKRMKRGLILKK